MPRGKKNSATKNQDKPKGERKPKMERRKRGAAALASASGSRSVTRIISDTVGICLALRAEDKPPKEGGMAHVKTEKGEEFDLRISKVQPKKHGGYAVWCWLRKEAKDGPRFRSVRLQQATITWRSW